MRYINPRFTYLLTWVAEKTNSWRGSPGGDAQWPVVPDTPDHWWYSRVSGSCRAWMFSGSPSW